MFGLGTVTRETLVARLGRANAAQAAHLQQLAELEVRQRALAGEMIDDEVGDVRRELGGVIQDLAKARNMREALDAAVDHATAALAAFDREEELKAKRRNRAAMIALVAEREAIAAEFEAQVEALGTVITRLRENALAFSQTWVPRGDTPGGLSCLNHAETTVRIMAWLSHKLPDWLAPDEPAARVHFASAPTFVLAERRYSAHLIPPDPDAPAAEPPPAAPAGDVGTAFASPG